MANTNTKRRFGRSRTQPVVEWEHLNFGSFQLKVLGFRLGETRNPDECPNSWTQVLVGKTEPGTLSIDVASQPFEGVHMFQAVGPKLVDCSEADPEQFRIKVEWENGRPKTRQKDADNFNLIFIDEDGKFVVNQISLVTRPSSDERRFGFWICIQELYVGQIVAISGEQANKLGGCAVAESFPPATVVPLHAEYAHRMANPFTMFPECRELVAYAVNNGLYEEATDYTRPEWKPVFMAKPALPKDENLSFPANRGNWETAAVAWYNLVLGFGHVIMKDGKSCFVHFKSIHVLHGVDTNPVSATTEMPILHPMQPVLVRYRDTDKGRQATFVAPLAPVTAAATA